MSMLPRPFGNLAGLLESETLAIVDGGVWLCKITSVIGERLSPPARTVCDGTRLRGIV